MFERLKKFTHNLMQKMMKSSWILVSSHPPQSRISASSLSIFFLFLSEPKCVWIVLDISRLFDFFNQLRLPLSKEAKEV